MEYTNRYYKPIARRLSQAGLFVNAANPQIVSNFQEQDNPLYKAKTNTVNPIKIARHTLDNWTKLKQYSLMDELCSQLKTMNQ